MSSCKPYSSGDWLPGVTIRVGVPPGSTCQGSCAWELVGYVTSPPNMPIPKTTFGFGIAPAPGVCPPPVTIVLPATLLTKYPTTLYQGCMLDTGPCSSPQLSVR